MLPEVSAEAELAAHVLGHAHESEPRIVERHAVLRVPAPQKPAARFDRDAADGRPVVHPPRIPEPYPGLRGGLFHVLDVDPAHAVREDVVLGARHRVRLPVEPQFPEARKEFLFMLATEEPEYPVTDDLRPFAGRDHELEAQEVLVVEPRLSGHRRRGRVFRGGYSHGFVQSRATVTPGPDCVRTSSSRPGLDARVGRPGGAGRRGAGAFRIGAASGPTGTR